MKILGLIPARGGSKGVKRKNIKLLGTKPLIAYTIETALQSHLIDAVVVSTDDDEIASIARENGASVPFMRPAELATDSSPSIDAIVHSVKMLAEEGFEAVCLLQPTYPFRALNDVEDAITKFIESKVDTLISMVKVPHEYHPNWVYIARENGCVQLSTGGNEPTSRRQDLKPAYIRDGAIYLTKTSVILANHTLYGRTILPFEMKNSHYVNIDTPTDWERAQKHVEHKYE
jgi:CMP-N-acetylneuraminic acid synthetase